MFTGIVEDLGTVIELAPVAGAVRLTIGGATLADVRPGDSVSVNGVCLTAVVIEDSRFTADVIDETLRHSTLGALRVGDRVNLERAVTPITRLGGHIVQGHVDGVGIVSAHRSTPERDDLDVDLPGGLAKYVVLKGSITVDGVSLTVASVEANRVSVSLIPETLARTTLGVRDVGDTVNVEVDVLAKYVERLLAGGVVAGGQA